MDNLDQELYDVLNVHQPTGCAGGHCWGVDKLKTIITTQKQELLDEIEKELPEPAAHRYMSEENPCCIEAKAYDRALDQVKSIITTKRGEI